MYQHSEISYHKDLLFHLLLEIPRIRPEHHITIFLFFYNNSYLIFEVINFTESEWLLMKLISFNENLILLEISLVMPHLRW
jgi:hypothetical protein